MACGSFGVKAPRRCTPHPEICELNVETCVQRSRASLLLHKVCRWSLAASPFFAFPVGEEQSVPRTIVGARRTCGRRTRRRASGALDTASGALDTSRQCLPLILLARHPQSRARGAHHHPRCNHLSAAHYVGLFVLPRQRRRKLLEVDPRLEGAFHIGKEGVHVDAAPFGAATAQTEDPGVEVLQGAFELLKRDLPACSPTHRHIRLCCIRVSRRKRTPQVVPARARVRVRHGLRTHHFSWANVDHGGLRMRSSPLSVLLLRHPSNHARQHVYLSRIRPVTALFLR